MFISLSKFIGEIVWDREAYHTNRYIFPVGFMSKKQYLSAVDVTRRTTYTSEILDGGDTPIVSEFNLMFMHTMIICDINVYILNNSITVSSYCRRSAWS
jgi:hypothetical protein